jgi:Domain of unknown function (DU1801)
MVSSKEKTPSAYLASLPAEQRAVIAAVRAVILANLPEGYVESMNWGMLSYEVPLSRYPNTYNKQPLSYAGLASQKNNYSVYLLNVYFQPALLTRIEEWYTAHGKRCDMGKCCLRFKRIADIPLDLIGELVASTTVDEMIALTVKAHPDR